MGEREKPIWQLYAWVYDSILLRFLPYRMLMEAVTDSLEAAPGWLVLDAGCGTGNHLARIMHTQPGVKAVGIDFSPAMLHRARAKLGKEQGVILQEANLNHLLPFPEETFDAVICVNVLYAVQEPALLLHEIHRVLKEGGRLVLVTPSFQPKMSHIFREHVNRLRETVPLLWPMVLAGQILWTTPLLLVFMIINHLIQNTQSFHFVDDKELCSLMDDCGFTITSMEKVYGKQAWFVVGKR